MAETTPPVQGNVYTEAQHFSLVKSAVEKANADLTTEKSELVSRVATLESEKAALAGELSEAKTQIDVLESAKATAEAAAETAKKSFEDFKSELERKAQVEDKKSNRKDRVKAANENLGDTYFTDERVTRWAEMSDESFDALISEMTEFAAAAKPASSDDTKTAKTTEQASSTKAFTGGETASEQSAGGKSALSSLFQATGLGAA